MHLYLIKVLLLKWLNQRTQHAYEAIRDLLHRTTSLVLYNEGNMINDGILLNGERYIVSETKINDGITYAFKTSDYSFSCSFSLDCFNDEESREEAEEIASRTCLTKLYMAYGVPLWAAQHLIDVGRYE